MVQPYTLDDCFRRLSTGLSETSSSSSPFSSGSKQGKGLGTGKILQETVGCHPFTSLYFVFFCCADFSRSPTSAFLLQHQVLSKICYVQQSFSRIFRSWNLGLEMTRFFQLFQKDWKSQGPGLGCPLLSTSSSIGAQSRNLHKSRGTNWTNLWPCPI